jgi:hypothetical protein
VGGLLRSSQTEHFVVICFKKGNQVMLVKINRIYSIRLLIPKRQTLILISGYTPLGGRTESLFLQIDFLSRRDSSDTCLGGAQSRIRVGGRDLNFFCRMFVGLFMRVNMTTHSCFTADIIPFYLFTN